MCDSSSLLPPLPLSFSLPLHPSLFLPFSAIKEIVVQSVRCQLEVACCRCPRLSYLTDNEILKVASHSGNPVPIIPLISKIFPAVHNLRLIEVSVAANDPTHTDQGMYYKHQVSVNLWRVLWHHCSDAPNMQYLCSCINLSSETTYKTFCNQV